MSRHALLSTLGVVVLLVLAGCTTGVGPGTDASPTATPAGSPTTTPGSSTPEPVKFEYYTFDHGGIEDAVLEGGIVHEDDSDTGQTYVTTIANESATARFNQSLLPAAARNFVANTSFDESFLVVVQTFPASSVPDARVESVSRDGGRLYVGINDSSKYATDDITVETVLVRVSGSVPDRITLTGADNVTVDATGQLLRNEPAPTPTPEPDVELPYAADNGSENGEHPRGLHLRNDGNETNGYDLRVTYHDRPACREDSPPCGEPAEELTILERSGKIRPGANLTLPEFAVRTGPYTVEITAELPTDDGSRRTVTDSYDWNLTADAGDVRVRLTDSTVTISETQAGAGPESRGR